MSKKYNLIFLSFGLLNLLAEAFQFTLGIYISKPLLMMILALLYWNAIGRKANRFDSFIFAALFFSFGGDTLLMFVESNPSVPQFFLFGLGSFLFAHCFYIAAFLYFPPSKFILKWPTLLFLISLSTGLLFFLWPDISSDMRPAIIVYALAISLMGLTAYAMLFKVGSKIGMLFVYGALLFILSDSLIAINKFKTEELVLYPRISIMLTYILAQLLLINGAVKASISIRNKF